MIKFCECKCHRWDFGEWDKHQCCHFSGEKNVRPWGRYDILLDEYGCKVKKIVILPNKQLSYQYHTKHSETWKIIEGEGIAIINDVQIPVMAESLITVERLAKHRIKNTGIGALVFIEIQTGESCDEGDIVRIEDDYGRT